MSTIMKEKLQHNTTRLLLLCILLSLLVGVNAQTLTHSYTFEPGTWSGTTVNDQIGSANGTINGTDWEIKNGYFYNHNSNQASGSTMGGYISFSGTALALNTYTAITLEAYVTYTMDQNNPNKWSCLAYFGGATGTNSFMLQPETMDGTSSRAGLNNAVFARGTETAAKQTHHYVAVLTPSTASVAGSVALYIDGSLAQSSTLTAGSYNTAVSAIATTNAFLGKGGWTDPLSTLPIHEFNIYNGAMDATTVATRYAAMNTKLATLTVDAGTLTPTFDANIYNYGVVVPAGTTSLNVGATAASANYSSINGAGAIDVSGADHGIITLKASATGTPYMLCWSKAVATPVLMHSYPFTDGTANDAVGADVIANGTLSSGAAGKIANGLFTTTASNNYWGGNSQYISLPASTIGIQNYPVVSFEVVAKTTAANYYSYFGNQTIAGDGTTSNGTSFPNNAKGVGTDYLFLHTVNMVASCNENLQPWTNNSTVPGTAMSDGKVHHVVGIMKSDSMLLYQDGVLKQGLPITSNVNRLFNISANVAYIGRSGYNNDLNFLGSIGEYNIWKGRLTPSTISTRATSYLRDATLSSITLSTGTLTFNPNTTSYTVTVPSGTTSVTVAATASKDFATITGTGTVTLDGSGNGTATLIVTSADGTTQKTYIVTFGVPVPTITTSAATLNKLDENNSRTFTVVGANLQANINIIAPVGFSVSPTNITPDGSGIVSATTVTVSYTGTGGANWSDITLSSTNATSRTVKVRATYNGSCCTPTYADKTNLVTDPYMNSLSNYTSSWGGATIDTTTVYCGLNSGKVSGTRAGSITYNLLNLWKPNTKYRLKAKIYTPTASTFNFYVSGWSGATGDIGANITTTAIAYTTNAYGTGVSITAGNWNDVDFAFTTGTLSAVNQYFYFNNYSANSSGTSYIDNIEFYEIERYVSSNSNLSTLTSANSTNEEVVVNAGTELTVDANSTVKSITVAPGAKLTVASGNTLSAALTLQSSPSGTATFVDANPTGSTITATVQQYLPQGRNWYVGVPFTTASGVGASALTATGTGTTVSYYDEPTSAWVNNYSGTLTSGVGYVAVSNPTDGSATNNMTFSGTLNTGSITVPLSRKGATKAGFNLVANPYPSYLNAMAAINANANMENTIWYRTRSASAYYFETVNTTSGVGTNNAGTGIVTGYIPPMQAFWVRTTTDNNSITFTNAMRAHAGNITLTDGQTVVPTTLMKAGAVKNTLPQMLRLKVSNGTNSDETVIYTNDNASNNYDAFDSQKMTNNSTSIPELFSIADNNNLAINGINCVYPNMEIPLGFFTKESNNFSIKATQISNLEATNIVLRDNLLQTEQILTDTTTAYSFSSDATTSANRFSIVFRSGSVTTSVNKPGSQLAISVYENKNGQIVIDCPFEMQNNSRATLCNAIGQVQEIAELTGSRTVLRKTKPGIYIVSVVANGKNSINKVVIE
jgi:hypothetical protein